MTEQRHIIKRQIIELTVQDSVAAPALQDEVSRVYRRRIVPLIDRCFSELSKPDRIYRIDSLELDLGELDPHHLEEQLVAKVNTALRRELAAHIHQQEQQPQRSPKAQSALELFAFFMQTGSLPWWADDSQPRLLTENLRQLLYETPQELRRLLQDLAQEEPIRRRIIGQYGDEQLADIAGLLLPAYKTTFKHAKTLIAILQKTVTAASWLPSHIRRSVWDNFLQVAALGGQQYPSLEAFYQAVLKRVAAELGTTDNHLLDEIQQVLGEGQVRASREFKELLGQLTQSASEGLLQRLAQLQAESDGPLAEAWAGLRTLVPDLSGPLRARWLSVLRKRPTPQRVLQLLQSELAARLQSYQFGGEVWAALRVLTQRLPPQAQAAWLNALEAAGGENAAEGVIRLLNADPARHGLRPEERAGLLKMLRAAAPLIPPILNPKNGGPQGGPLDLRFSAADELSVANAGLVILWPFLMSFFIRLGLLEDKQFKDLAARQRAVGLLQVIATKDAAPPEYLLPLNKLLCGLEPKQVFDFGPPLLKTEAKECAKLLKAVIAQAAILHKMSADGFRGSFLLRPGLLSVRDGFWLLRVERQTYDIVLERFPWSWQWVKLPWMETPLRVEW